MNKLLAFIILLTTVLACSDKTEENSNSQPSTTIYSIGRVEFELPNNWISELDSFTNVSFYKKDDCRIYDYSTDFFGPYDLEKELRWEKEDNLEVIREIRDSIMFVAKTHPKYDYEVYIQIIDLKPVEIDSSKRVYGNGQYFHILSIFTHVQVSEDCRKMIKPNELINQIRKFRIKN